MCVSDAVSISASNVIDKYCVKYRYRIKHYLFKILCKKIGLNHIVFIFRIDVKWLSRELVLAWLYELQPQSLIFLQKQKYLSSKHVGTKKFPGALAYQSDNSFSFI